MKRKMQWMVLVVVALTVSLVAVSQAKTARGGVLKQIEGIVEVRQQGGEWQAAQDGMTLSEGDEVRAGEKSSAVIMLDGDFNTGLCFL